MAAISTDLATAFFGLARRQAAVGFRSRGTLLSLLPRHFRAAAASRAFLPRAAVAVPSPGSRRGPRRFGSSTTASSSYAAAADEEEIDGVQTKIPPDNRIPATIITGFLGSGKTTLLNHILTADHGKRIAVIENEYGEVDIDGSLVAAKTTGAEDIVMLNNGCLCCTVRGDLVRMIAELVDKKKGKFDHIVIETTDHADHHVHDHTHDPGVSSVSIVCEGNLDLDKANMWLGTLLMEHSDDIYRMKGLLAVNGMNERFVFQGVHDIFQGSPDRPWGQDEQRINKIVFIGKNLDALELEKGFKSCLMQ